MTSLIVGLVLGVVLALVGHALMIRFLLGRFRSSMRRLNRGDPGPLLSSYASDAVMHFSAGDHRWAGTYRGKPAIEWSLHDYVRSGTQGEILDLAASGPPWRMRLVARFDDHALAPDGSEIYRNRAVLHVVSRWGRVVEQRDFHEDTGRLIDFDRRLTELGIEPSRSSPVSR